MKSGTVASIAATDRAASGREATAGWKRILRWLSRAKPRSGAARVETNLRMQADMRRDLFRHMQRYGTGSLPGLPKPRATQLAPGAGVVLDVPPSEATDPV